MNEPRPPTGAAGQVAVGGALLTRPVRWPAEDIGKGRVSVNGQVAKPSRELHPGDRVAHAPGPRVERTVDVLALEPGARPGPGGAGPVRGNAESIAARLLPPSSGAWARAGHGIEQGRPTKRDRRQLADWQRWSASADDLPARLAPA
jgi:ribosome-associated heat shock protein Hsp15